MHTCWPPAPPEQPAAAHGSGRARTLGHESQQRPWRHAERTGAWATGSVGSRASTAWMCLEKPRGDRACPCLKAGMIRNTVSPSGGEGEPRAPKELRSPLHPKNGSRQGSTPAPIRGHSASVSPSRSPPGLHPPTLSSGLRPQWCCPGVHQPRGAELPHRLRVPAGRELLKPGFSVPARGSQGSFLRAR